MTVPDTIPCRLCEGKGHHVFHKTVLGHRRVAYYRCGNCGSQQTDYPTWLDEAYAIPGVHIDVGCASRTVKNWLGASVLLDRLGFPREALGVDFGAASGLFARLMRDVGYEMRSQDKYARSAFTSYYNVDDVASARPRLITAFEVFEHLPEPAQSLAELFSAGADLVLFTTWFCDGQDEDWIYYLPECGQHVFFYSQQAMAEFAGRYGYDLTLSHFFMILSRRGAFDERQLQVITEFSQSSLAQVAAATEPTISSVIMGNAHIDRDFVDARARFTREREG